MSEPTIEELIQRLDMWNEWDKRGVKGNHLRIWRHCPNCHGDNTEWIRNQYYACYDCLITFTLEDLETCIPIEELTMEHLNRMEVS